MSQFQFIESLLMIGFGVFAFLQPQKIASNEGTLEQVEKRIRVMKRCGVVLLLAGVMLFVANFFR